MDVVLEADMKYQQVSLSPQDIELLASRRFQIEDIARFFGVPSVLINDTAATTSWGSGVQQIVEGWYKLGLRPFLERYQDSMKAWLLPPEEQAIIDIEFDLDELLQPSFAERVKTNKEAVTGGFMTPNEARLQEGWQPQEGGDKLYMQQQMTPLGTLETMQRDKTPTGEQQVAIAMATKPQAPVFNLTMPEIKMSSAPINITSPDIKMPAVENKYEMAAPVVNLTVQNPAQPDVVVNVPQGKQPDIKVDVAAPEVHFEATLPPPEVKVIMPKRKSNTKVKYDGNGNIVETNQIEEDV
jgi:hypothetical protein